jgi:hypothetical protein
MTGIGALVIHDGTYLALLVLACASIAIEALRAADDRFEAIHRPRITQDGCGKGLPQADPQSRYVRNLDEIREKIGQTRDAAEERSCGRKKRSRVPIHCAAYPRESAPC